MRNKRFAAIVLAVGMVGSLGFTACGGGKGKDVKVQVFENEADWLQAWEETLSATNVEINYTILNESPLSQRFSWKERQGCLQIADEKVYGHLSGIKVETFNREGEIVEIEQDSAIESYISRQDDSFKEYYRENYGVWECVTWPDFNFNVQYTMSVCVNCFELGSYVEMYSECTVEDGYYCYSSEQEGETMSVRLQFANGKLYSCELNLSSEFEEEGLITVETVQASMTISYGGVTIGDILGDESTKN